MSDRLPSNSADGSNQISLFNTYEGNTKAEVINQGVGDVYMHIFNDYKAGKLYVFIPNIY